MKAAAADERESSTAVGYSLYPVPCYSATNLAINLFKELAGTEVHGVQTVDTECTEDRIVQGSAESRAPGLVCLSQSA